MNRPATALPLSLAAHGAALAAVLALSIARAELPAARAASPEPPLLPVVHLPGVPQPRRPPRIGVRGPVTAREARTAVVMPSVSAPTAEELTPGDLGEESPSGVGEPCVGCDFGGPGPIDAGLPPAGTGGGGGGPLRIGGVIREPRNLRRINPGYPDIARAARVQGLVVLECTLTPEGRVSDVRVVSGHPLLSPAATRAVEQWLFTPTLLNGVPVPVIMTVTVKFELR